MHWIGIRENGGEPDFDNYHKHFDFVAKSWPLRPLHFTESRGEKHNNALLIWMGSGLTLQSSAMQRGLLKGQRQFQNHKMHYNKIYAQEWLRVSETEIPLIVPRM